MVIFYKFIFSLLILQLLASPRCVYSLFCSPVNLRHFLLRNYTVLGIKPLSFLNKCTLHWAMQSCFLLLLFFSLDLISTPGFFWFLNNRHYILSCKEKSVEEIVQLKILICIRLTEVWCLAPAVFQTNRIFHIPYRHQQK